MLPSTTGTTHLNPADYDIDPETGLVAFNNSDLPTYYTPWKTLIVSLPELLTSKQIGIKINTLPILSTQYLTTEAHWRRAYVILGYLIQAYIWEDKDKPHDVVPVCLSAPFLDVCDHLGMEPVLSYAGLCLWNCVAKSSDPNFSSTTTTSESTEHPHDKLTLLSQLPQIKSYASFTGTPDEDAFNLIPVMVETKSAPLIPLLLSTIQCPTPSFTTLSTTLQTTIATLTTLTTTLLPLLHSNCHPSTFYHDIRPYLSGSANNTILFPNGVQLTHSNNATIRVKCLGGSAAQSTLFQFLDHVLSITHSDTSIPLSMRPYMPRPHRIFLSKIEALPSLLEIITRFPDQEREELMVGLAGCIDALRAWRSGHVNVVVRYIVSPAGGGGSASGTVRENGNGNRDGDGDGSGKEEKLKGTAGSLPLPFLKGFRDETRLQLVD